MRNEVIALHFNRDSEINNRTEIFNMVNALIGEFWAPEGTRLLSKYVRPLSIY